MQFWRECFCYAYHNHLTKLLSHLERYDFIVPSPPPMSTVFWKKYLIKMTRVILATFCHTATLTRGRRDEKVILFKAALQFCSVIVGQSFFVYHPSTFGFASCNAARPGWTTCIHSQLRNSVKLATCSFNKSSHMWEQKIYCWFCNSHNFLKSTRSSHHQLYFACYYV